MVLALAPARPAWGQSPSGPYPKFKDGVGRLPPALTEGAPPALIPRFDAPPPDRNAAPLYLDALFEFGGTMVSCFPEGPERERRKKLADDRWARMEYVTTRSSMIPAVQAARLNWARPQDSRPVESAAKPSASSSRTPSKAESPSPNEINAVFARMTPAGLAKQVDRLNAYYSALLALKDVPCAERLSRLPDVSKFFPSDDEVARYVTGLLPAVTQPVAAAGRMAATRHASECFIALRRWQLTHGGATPRDLATAFEGAGLSAVPSDPFDGKPMRRVFVEGKPVIYSIGKDGRDDGGLRDSDGDRHGGDLIFRQSPPVN